MQIQRILAAAIVGGFDPRCTQASAEIQKYNFEVVGTWVFLRTGKSLRRNFDGNVAQGIWWQTYSKCQALY